MHVHDKVCEGLGHLIIYAFRRFMKRGTTSEDFSASLLNRKQISVNTGGAFVILKTIGPLHVAQLSALAPRTLNFQRHSNKHLISVLMQPAL